jgi:TATA-box binding protein (TBP) (component of TFIID and TFIIIB)
MLGAIFASGKVKVSGIMSVAGVVIASSSYINRLRESVM